MHYSSHDILKVTPFDKPQINIITLIQIIIIIIFIYIFLTIIYNL